MLGPVEVRRDGRPVPVRRGRPRALLATLALYAPDVVPADVLIDRVWGDDLPANPSNALQLQVSYLRRALTEAAGEPGAGGDGPLITEPPGYRLAIAADDVDLRRVERLLGEARDASSAANALAACEQALGSWRGAPLLEIGDHPAVAGEVTRIGELRRSLAELRIDALMDLGRLDDAIADLGPLVDEHPLHERFRAQLMLALYRSGRQADALRAFQVARERFVGDLGLEPGPELVTLEAAILDQEPSLGSHGRRVATGDVRAPLPSPPATRLIGRTSAVAHVRDLLGSHRLVSVTGPGGAGKTRVAIEALRLVAEDDPSRPLLFVDLGALHADEDVAIAVADAVHVPTSLDRSAATAVAERLGPLPGVLLLDTCEHVADQVASLVDELLRVPGGRISVLATSRRPLGVPGEVVSPLASLGLPRAEADPDEAAGTDAVRLFCERASGVRPDFRLDASNVADVVAICRSVDGLPLAIEIAAAHADVLGVAEIRSRVGGRLDLLRGHDVGGPDRHRALRATIEWSAGLLDAAELDLLTQLSVLAGSFDLDAAAAVAGSDDVLPALASLVRQSLVVAEPDGRYRLFDAVRSYASTTPADALRRAASDRHARHFTDRARAADRAVRGPRHDEAMAAVDRDLPNFRAALRWAFDHLDDDTGADLAASLAWIWTVRGNTVEADQWLRAARAREGLGERARVRTLLAASMVAAPAGDLEAALALALDAAAHARDADLPLHTATALLNAGVAQWALGRYGESVATLEEALDGFRAEGSDRGAALSVMNLARSTLELGDSGRASELLDEAGGLADELDDPQLRSLTTCQRARLALHVGDADAALLLATRSLAQAEEHSHAETVLASLHVLGRARLALGEVDEARALHRRALELATETHHVGATIEAVEALGEVAVAEGRPDRAAPLLAAAGAERIRRARPIPGRDAARSVALLDGVPAVSFPPSFRDVVDELRSEAVPARPGRTPPEEEEPDA